MDLPRNQHRRRIRTPADGSQDRTAWHHSLAHCRRKNPRGVDLIRRHASRPTTRDPAEVAAPRPSRRSSNPRMDILPRNPKTEANQTSQDGVTSHLDNAPSKAQKKSVPLARPKSCQGPTLVQFPATHCCHSRNKSPKRDGFTPPNLLS